MENGVQGTSQHFTTDVLSSNFVASRAAALSRSFVEGVLARLLQRNRITEAELFTVQPEKDMPTKRSYGKQSWKNIFAIILHWFPEVKV